jgi:mono/diheme cytochrome c family protein
MAQNAVPKVAATCAALIVLGAGRIPGADQAPPNYPQIFQNYCFDCHGNGLATAGVSLEKLTSGTPVADNYQVWERVVAALSTHHMPPEGNPQPTDAERQQAVTWIRAQLDAYIRTHTGDPGRVTVRRLTSGEYGYTIHDLTGLDLDLGIDASTDSVGGEGFTNFGDVQFMQNANLERYLEAAKTVADHAVVGAGPLQFYSEPGKTGFEMSGIHRIQDIYTRFGFRVASGEGGFPYGLETYTKVLFVDWQYRNRMALGQPTATLASLAAREGITARFAQHVWTVMNRTDLAYPSSEMAARFHKLPTPTSDIKASLAAGRAACDELQKFLTGWPGWLFGRGDKAYGGAGDESPLIINEKSLKVEGSHHFSFTRAGGRGGQPATKLYLNVVAVNPAAKGKPIAIWRNPTVAFRQPGAAVPARAGGRAPAPTRVPLRTVVTADTARKLNFGASPDGTTIGADDFAAELSTSFEVVLPTGSNGFDFQADPEVGADRDQVFRIVLTDREDGSSRGIPIRALIGDPKSSGYQTFKAGVLQLADLLPPNSNGEATPADKDPIPEPFDSTPNVPEHDAFDNDVKYVRDDHFIYRNILDDATRTQVDNAWNDIYASFGYQDNYLKLIAEHYHVDLHSKHIGELTKADFDAMPAEPRQYALGLRATYNGMLAAQAAGRARHVNDCLEFASRAWRRPLTDKEKTGLRAFYDKTLAEDSDHTRAIKTLIARILVAPEFLYRLEQPAVGPSGVQPLTNWELASRLSYLIWSSIPDDELRHAAAAGELTDAAHVRKQAARMLADPKARRMATEFFGQWLGFYQFDQFKGVDTSRFPEFTSEIRSSMYDEAVSFFEHIIRQDRPVNELLHADYTFLNAPLAKFYGIDKTIKSKEAVEMVDGATAFHRGGLLRLGAILTATSAPLRTSPVRRGDWVLRRILGIAVPPPPPDAGSIPADDKLFGGMSVRERLQVHKRNATCATCHTRIDPMGFPLEHYDSTGRWRDKYADGKPIEDFGTLRDQTQVNGVTGLLDYLTTQQDQVQRTLAHKLVGYALGRTLQLSDEPLVNSLAALGGQSGFSRLVGEIVVSKQFRNHVTQEEPQASPNISSKAGGQ